MSYTALAVVSVAQTVALIALCLVMAVEIRKLKRMK